MQERAFGNAGDINIATGILTLNSGLLDAGILGQGNAGNININAQGAVTVTSQKDNLNSGIVSTVSTEAIGNAGNINIKSSSLTLSNEASLSTFILGQGNAGNISIQTSDAVELTRGFIASSIGTGGVGNGGEINITAGSLSLTDSSEIQSRVEGNDDRQPGGRGNAGNVNINVQGNISFRNSRPGESNGIYSDVDKGAIGNGGNVTINTNSLEINDGSEIQGSTRGKGNSGNIIINARNNISLDGRNRDFFSRIINNVQQTAEGNAGNIQITTGTLKAINGAFISSSTNGKGNAGNISINAFDNITFDTNSFSISGVGNQGVGDGGNIQITTGSLLVTNGGTISSFTAGVGNAGNITINTRDNVTFSGFADILKSSGGIVQSNSEVSTYGVTNAIGKAGDIRITASNLLLKDGGQLNADNAGEGSGGNIFLNVGNTINFDGIGGKGLPSGLYTTAYNGNAGNIQIETGSLSLTNGGSVFSPFLEGKGNGGNIIINARDTVIIDGVSKGVTLSGGEIVDFNSGLFSSLLSGKGKAGDIKITTGSLFLTNGAMISGETGGQGNGGNITIDARDRILIDGVNARGSFSNISSTATSTAVGNGGNINLTTDSLYLSNGGRLSTSSFGQGKAGDININSGSTTLDNPGFIAAITYSGDGGNINLNVDKLLLLRRGSGISTSAGTAQSGGDSGNININSRFIVAIPKEGSDIIANAFTGTGGNVEIKSQGVFGIEARPKPTEKSDITASSEQGIAGTISINAPDTSSIQNSFTELFPVIDTNALIANSCISRGTKRQENSFTITGSGALSPNRPGVSVSTYTTGEVRGVETTSRPWKKGDPIIEPTGLYRLNNGQLLLSRECSN
ncbi:beta strand repeat-containing protein [Nostoc sp.]|uniref:beta strand repeat-containing protein n=1 Tax=Nostoc sp. TaxID=1180 RepID=UPI002FFB6F00